MFRLLRAVKMLRWWLIVVITLATVVTIAIKIKRASRAGFKGERERVNVSQSGHNDPLAVTSRKESLRPSFSNL